MESLNLKVEERSTLYYGKYKYRVAINYPFLHLAYWCNSIKKLREQIADDAMFHELNKVKGEFVHPTEKEYKQLGKILAFKKKFRKDKDVGTRHEGNSISFFCNDTTRFNDVKKIIPDATITEVKLLPAGVKYFTKEPKFNYRLHLKSKKVGRELKEELLDYVSRTPDLYCNYPLETWLRYSGGYKHIWMRDNCTIDYNNESVLTMMHLLFPTITGKSFKLEKRPD
jgi:hypothetical protein